MIHSGVPGFCKPTPRPSVMLTTGRSVWDNLVEQQVECFVKKKKKIMIISCNNHHRFLLSGADVVTTATYQASVAGFVSHMDVNPEGARELLMSGVHLARESVRKFVSSSHSTGIQPDVDTGWMPEQFGVFFFFFNLFLCPYRAERTVCGRLRRTIRGFSSQRFRIHRDLCRGDECRGRTH